MWLCAKIPANLFVQLQFVQKFQTCICISLVLRKLTAHETVNQYLCTQVLATLTSLLSLLSLLLPPTHMRKHARTRFALKQPSRKSLQNALFCSSLEAPSSLMLLMHLFFYWINNWKNKTKINSGHQENNAFSSYLMCTAVRTSITIEPESSLWKSTESKFNIKKSFFCLPFE